MSWSRILALFLSRNSESMCLAWSAHDEENALRSDMDSSPDLKEMWEYGCPKKVRFGAARSGREVRMLRLWSIMSTRNEGCVWVGAQSPWILLVFEVPGKKEKVFRGSSSLIVKPGRWVTTVLNILCLRRNEGFPSFCLCASLFFVAQKVERRRVLPFERVLRLRTGKALMLFLACVWKVLLN